LLVVIVSFRAAIAIVTDSLACAAKGFALSLALTVNVLVPVAVGVPVITPPELRLNPAGSAPDTLDHVYGPIPPLAVSFAENGLVTLPVSVPGAVSVSGGAMTSSVNCCDALGAIPLSAVIVTMNLLTVRGGTVPDKTPLAGSIVSQRGAPESANVGAGTPIAVTSKPTTLYSPPDAGATSDVPDVKLGANTPVRVNASVTEPSPAPASPNTGVPIA
jgi:hypothetical protein